jgi:hypothetical protein
MSGKLSIGTFRFSVIIHGAVLLLAGGYVVFEGVVPRDSFVAVDALASVQEDMEVLPEPAEELDPLPSAPMAPSLELGGAATDEEVVNPVMLDVITAASSTGSFNLSLPTAVVPNLQGLPGVGGKGLAGGGGAGGTGAGSKGAVRTFFNQSVEIKKLGVVIDRSSSMSGYMKVVFEEIGNKFADAPYLAKASQSNRLFLTERDTKQSGFPAEGVNEAGQYNSEARHCMVPPAFDLLIVEKVNAIYWFRAYPDHSRDPRWRSKSRSARREEGAYIKYIRDRRATWRDGFLAQPRG